MHNNISFIIPTYNGDKFLLKTISSIYNGNFVEGDEIIVIDDYSTDGTRNIVKELLKNQKIHKLILLEKNIGEGFAKNIGIKQIKNKYFFCLDQDNILASNSIMPLRNVIGKYDAVTFGEIRYFQFSTLLISHKHFFKKGVIKLEEFERSSVNPGFSGNLLYSKKAWQRVNGFENVVLESWNIMYKMILEELRIMTLPNTYYFHRFGHNSAYVNASKKLNAQELIEKAKPIGVKTNYLLTNQKSQIRKNLVVLYLVTGLRKLLDICF